MIYININSIFFGNNLWQKFLLHHRTHKALNAAKGTQCWGEYPFGDDPSDQEMIEAGIRYARENGY